MIFKLPVGASDARIFNLIDFQHWELDINFSCPKDIQNKLCNITTEVEKACPVGLALGKIGCGEGVVWQTEWLNYRLLFKVKGTKHSSSKVKTLASVDTEEHASIQSFIEYAGTDNTLFLKKLGQIIDINVYGVSGISIVLLWKSFFTSSNTMLFWE